MRHVKPFKALQCFNSDYLIALIGNDTLDLPNIVKCKIQDAYDACQWTWRNGNEMQRILDSVIEGRLLSVLAYEPNGGTAENNIAFIADAGLAAIQIYRKLYAFMPDDTQEVTVLRNISAIATWVERNVGKEWRAIVYILQTLAYKQTEADLRAGNDGCDI